MYNVCIRVYNDSNSSSYHIWQTRKLSGQCRKQKCRATSSRRTHIRKHIYAHNHVNDSMCAIVLNNIMPTGVVGDVCVHPTRFTTSSQRLSCSANTFLRVAHIRWLLRTTHKPFPIQFRVLRAEALEAKRRRLYKCVTRTKARQTYRGAAATALLTLVKYVCKSVCEQQRRVCAPFT